MSTTYTLAVESDNLIVKHRRISDFNLYPINKDIFEGTVWFFGKIEFVRNDNNKISGIKVSNGRVRNLYFKKINFNK